MSPVELSMAIVWAGVVIGATTYAACAWRENR